MPILRAGRVIGVLAIQNRARRAYTEDEIEAMQIIASVLAEMVATGELVDQSKYADLSAETSAMRRLDGDAPGRGRGDRPGVLHEPRVEVSRLLAENPQTELARLDRATVELRETLDQMLAPAISAAASIARCWRPTACSRRTRAGAPDAGGDRHRSDGRGGGAKVQNETRARIGHVSDPYLRERLTDLDDLANRLLRILVGGAQPRSGALPEEAIVVARNLGPADLLEYDRAQAAGDGAGGRLEDRACGDRRARDRRSDARPHRGCHGRRSARAIRW